MALLLAMGMYVNNAAFQVYKDVRFFQSGGPFTKQSDYSLQLPYPAIRESKESVSNLLIMSILGGFVCR